MMGLGRADTDDMSLWEYEGRLWHWNEAHSTDGGDLPGPDPKTAMVLLERINADPRLTH